MPKFEFAAPTSLDEALGLLAGPGEARPLAGGTDLIDQLLTGRRQADLVVDLKRIPELLRLDSNGDGLHIGGATSCTTVYHDPRVAARYAAVAEACGLIGSVQIQNTGTLAGNICNASPAADGVPALMALDTQVEIMRPEDVGLTETNIVMGKHSGRAALRSKLENLGYELGDNQLKDVFVRFKELADRKKEIYDDDLIALMRTATDPESDRIVLGSMTVVCGTEGPQKAEMSLTVDGAETSTSQTGDGPGDASFNCIKALVEHTARLQLYQVHAVTEGTDAQATVSVRLEEDGKIATGQSADTDTDDGAGN